MREEAISFHQIIEDTGKASYTVNRDTDQVAK